MNRIGIKTLLPTQYDGKSEKFVFVDKNLQQWMCKFDKIQGNRVLYDSISEHISCNFFNLMGVPTQYTYFSTLYEKDCVYCRIDYEMRSLKDIKSYNVEDKLIYDVDVMMQYNIDNQYVDIESFQQYLVNRIPLDYIIMNIDLHPGNIGFYKENGIYQIGYVYDLGGSLLSKYFNNRENWKKKARNIKETIIIGGRKLNIVSFILEYSSLEEIYYLNDIWMNNRNYFERSMKTGETVKYYRNIEDVVDLITRRFQNLINRLEKRIETY